MSHGTSGETLASGFWQGSITDADLRGIPLGWLRERLAVRSAGGGGPYDVKHRFLLLILRIRLRASSSTLRPGGRPALPQGRHRTADLTGVRQFVGGASDTIFLRLHTLVFQSVHSV